MDIYDINMAKFWSHRLIADELWSGNVILDVWCNKWYLKKLASKNIFYWIDFGNENLDIAKQNWYEQVYDIDLNKYDTFNVDKKFDIIVFWDVLEHIQYPEKVLNYFVDNYLKSWGKVIISLPNVANFMIRINLLFWKFDYTDAGILDKTHLHLYTLKSAKKLINNSWLKIDKILFSSNLFWKLIKYLPFLWTFLGYNLIFVCEKRS